MMHPAMRGHCTQRDIQELFWSLFKHTSYYGGVDKTLSLSSFHTDATIPPAMKWYSPKSMYLK